MAAVWECQWALHWGSGWESNWEPHWEMEWEKDWGQLRGIRTEQEKERMMGKNLGKK
jgi:hypothetical protein